MAKGCILVTFTYLCVLLSTKLLKKSLGKSKQINVVYAFESAADEGWSIFLYEAESWITKRSNRNRIKSFEMWCWSRILGVSWTKHQSNDQVLEELGLEKELMRNVAKLKLQYFGHVVRGSTGEVSLATLDEMIDGIRYQGAPRRCWTHAILERNGKTCKELKAIAQEEQRWKKLS